MVDLLFVEDDDALRKPGIVRTLYDPACGTGGMLSVAEEYLRELNPDARLEVFGQELNDESYAICKADMMIKGQNPENITRGNSFSEDGHVGKKFDYMLSNPPFGVEWKKVQKVIEDEHETQGFSGRFGPGLPRINDGSLLFLLHMMSKMKPARRTRRQPPRHRLQRLAALHRGRRLGRERDPPLDHRERLAGGHRRAARPALLQHRHQHLHLGASRTGSRRRARARSSSSTPWTSSRRCGSPSATSGTSCRRRTSTTIVQALRRLQGGRAVEDLRQRRLRLPAHRRGAAPAAELPGITRAHRAAAEETAFQNLARSKKKGKVARAGDRGGQEAAGARSWRPLASARPGDGLEEPRRVREGPRRGAERRLAGCRRR